MSASSPSTSRFSLRSQPMQRQQGQGRARATQPHRPRRLHQGLQGPTPDVFLHPWTAGRSMARWGHLRRRRQASARRQEVADAGVPPPVDLKFQYNNDHYGSSPPTSAALKSWLGQAACSRSTCSPPMDPVQQGSCGYRRFRRYVPGLPKRMVPGLLRPGQLAVLRDGNFVNNGYSNKKST